MNKEAKIIVTIFGVMNVTDMDLYGKSDPFLKVLINVYINKF